MVMLAAVGVQDFADANSKVVVAGLRPPRR